MKKLVALLVAMMMLLAMPFAYAEEEAEMPFEGEWYDFEDYMVYLPTGMVETEVTAEMEESGIYYALASEDNTHAIQFAYSALEKEVTIDELVAGFQETYGEDNVMTIEANGLTFVGYMDADNDAVCFLVADPVDLGLYMFVFVPASDDAFMETAGSILATVTFADGTEAAAE